MISPTRRGLPFSIDSQSLSRDRARGHQRQDHRRARQARRLLDAPLSHKAITWTAPFLNPFMHTSVMFRTDVIRDEFGGYDTGFRIAQDYELWTRVIARYQSANLPLRLVCYRHLVTSTSKVGRERAFAEATQISEGDDAHFWRKTRRRRGASGGGISRGLDPSNRQAFWGLYNRLLASHDSRTGDMPRTVAMHHLKAAERFLQNLHVWRWLRA
jgi:hypothetical protein